MMTIELLIVAIITPRVVLERTTQRYHGCWRSKAPILLAISEVYPPVRGSDRRRHRAVTAALAPFPRRA
jgi:hypothetical protein